MILCLCPNPAIDMYVWLQSLEPGQVNQSKKEERFPGGKGVHVALAASELGIPVALLGFWGGPTGQWIKERCEANGIACYGPEIENWSRTCLTFKADDRSDETELLGCGPMVSQKDFQDYIKIFEKLVPEAECVTMSGSWPQGIPDNAYAQLISKAQLMGKKVFLDCSGKQLKNALLQKPYAVHINLSEGRQLFNEVEVERIAMKLSHSCDWAAVTAGAEGLYMVTDEEFVHASCKVEKVYSAVGSGDCLVAGLAVAFVEHMNISQTAGLAVACGAANCIRPELGLLNKADVEILQEEVILEVIKFNSDVQMDKVMKDIDVIVVGELNVDLILNQIGFFPEIGKETLAQQMTLTLGSSSAIFASNLSSLGARVSFIGKIGNDRFGEVVLQSLEEKGVDVSLIQQSITSATGATVVLNFDEDRSMVTYPGAMHDFSLAEIPLENLKRAKHMHFSSYFLQAGLKKEVSQLFRLAKEFGLTTSLDTQWDPEEKWDLDLASVLPYVDVFLPNEKEIYKLTEKETIPEALEILENSANMIIIKMGNRGSASWHNGNLEYQGSFLNNDVVDAIGAGDSFNAGFIYKFIQGDPIAECQRFGNLIGAISTTKAGGTAAFEGYENIMKIAEERFGYTGHKTRTDLKY